MGPDGNGVDNKTLDRADPLCDRGSNWVLVPVVIVCSEAVSLLCFDNCGDRLF